MTEILRSFGLETIPKKTKNQLKTNKQNLNNDEKYSKGKETCYEKRNLVYFYMKKDSTRKNYKQMRKKQDRKKM